MIKIGPTGNVVNGHVLDVNRKAFNAALKEYDPFLYTKWNPKKLRGWGAWEIRRAPEFHSTLDIAEFEGNLIIKIGPYETDIVNHVLDAAFLNYDQIRKIKEMDTFKYGSAAQWQDKMRSKAEEAKQAAFQRSLQARKDAAKTFKNEIDAFKDFVRDGGNPHQIAMYWDKAQALG